MGNLTTRPSLNTPYALLVISNTEPTSADILFSPYYHEQSPEDDDEESVTTDEEEEYDDNA